jgi:hypothetical protein
MRASGSAKPAVTIKALLRKRFFYGEVPRNRHSRAGALLSGASSSFPRRRTAVRNKIAEHDLAYCSSFPRRRESITRVHLRRPGAKPQGITLSMDSRFRGNDEIAISSPEVAQVKLQAYAYEAASSLGIFIRDSKRRPTWQVLRLSSALLQPHISTVERSQTLSLAHDRY